MSDNKNVFDSAPLDGEGFILVDRWYCKESDTFYPAGTTTYEIERDVAEAHKKD